MARSPRAAIAATIGAPSFPKPMTLTLIGMTLPETMWPSGRLRGETKMPAQRALQWTQERRRHPPKIPFLPTHAFQAFRSPSEAVAPAALVRYKRSCLFGMANRPLSDANDLPDGR